MYLPGGKYVATGPGGFHILSAKDAHGAAWGVIGNGFNKAVIGSSLQQGNQQ